jgi:hypothetical protein
MPTRLIIAYVMIAALIIAGIALYARARHNSHERRYDRRMAGEHKGYVAKRAADEQAKETDAGDDPRS